MKSSFRYAFYLIEAAYLESTIFLLRVFFGLLRFIGLCPRCASRSLVKATSFGVGVLLGLFLTGQL